MGVACPDDRAGAIAHRAARDSKNALNMPGVLRDNKSRERGFPRFAEPPRPCPTSALRAHLKQVNPAAMPAVQRSFLNAAFGGFLTEAKPPGDVHALLAATSPNVVHEDRLPRRYDGDRTLPRGRYSTVCERADGDDNGTLVRELRYYKSARVTQGHVEVLDPALADDREMIGRLGMDTSDRDRIVVRVTPFAQLSQADSPSSMHFSIPVQILEAQVDNVLDLRRAAALDWLYETVPSLGIVLDAKGDIQPCFPFRRKLSAFAEILPSLVDQSRGGGNFDKLVGLYLRQLGVSGLVFPSVRSDAYTYVVDGEPVEFHGWTFVDYREAPPCEIAAFFELRPEWPRTLTIEGGDDNAATPAAFADEFRIDMTADFPSIGGTLAFRGLAQRTEAYQMVDSLEAALRFRLPDVSDAGVNELKRFAVSFGARGAIHFSAMVLYGLLGLEQAQTDLRRFVKESLGEHPLAPLLARCADPPPARGDILATMRSLFGVAPSAAS